MRVLGLADRFEACIIGGAIGDAWGSSYENESSFESEQNFVWGNIKSQEREWRLTDDTQLTLAACEAFCRQNEFSAQILAETMLRYYREKRLSGLGAATLKALDDMHNGIAWNRAARTGEYAAGNGAAMRIAPLAFFDLKKEEIREACEITHKNEEAYAGSLAVVIAIKAAVTGKWKGDNNLLSLVIPELPDTLVRDRMMMLDTKYPQMSVEEAAEFGKNGYVVNSVPFAIYAASKVKETGIKEMYAKVISVGGDTDTNASIAGQIAGAHLGMNGIDNELLDKLKRLPNYKWLCEIIKNTGLRLPDNS